MDPEKKKINPSRTRIYACIVYKDSAPENWQDILRSFYVPAFISPYHDKDIQANGEPKKPHWHVMIMFDGVKTVGQVKEIFDAIHGVGEEYIQSKRGYARYLCHLDDPNKARYDPKDVIEISGADYQDTISNSSDGRKCIKQMIEFIRRNHITSYCQIMDYAMDYETEWFNTLCNQGSYVIALYCKEQRYAEMTNS